VIQQKNSNFAQNLKKRGRTVPSLCLYPVFMDLVEEVKKIAETKLTPSQFIVDVLISAKKGPKKVMILADSDEGFSIEDCAQLSRHMAKVLDENGLIEDNYLLEVSTPGVDHPLKLKRQYHKNIGRSLKVKLAEGVVEGKLLSVSETAITLEKTAGSGKKKEMESIEIPISEIEKAFVLVSFK
jgi:ribosome maturation factor RimP